VASGLADHDVRATHRLVLLVAGGLESAWLDDQSISRTDDVAVTQAGGVETYLANRDSSSTATFDILRFVVYQLPAGG
jgi:hypothetical protein